jgi:hypothetical protein
MYNLEGISDLHLIVEMKVKGLKHLQRHVQYIIPLSRGEWDCYRSVLGLSRYIHVCIGH